MTAVSGVGARLGRAFLLQGAFIGVAAIVSVFLANVMLEGVLIRQALRDEASFYWSHRDADPAHPLPATLNLTGYIGDAPQEVAALAPGFHDWDDGSRRNVVYVTERAGERLVLVFDRSGVGRLVVLFGLLPLALVLLVLYLSTWLAFRASRRAFSPVVALARQVRELDPSAPEPGRFDRSRLPSTDDEVQELADALVRYSERLAEFIAREREFTRDASHELRSPLTVLHISAELLLADERLSDASRRAAERIRRAANDMDELTSAFLLLARESEAGLPTSALCVNDVVAAELERARVLAEDKPVESRFHASHRLSPGRTGARARSAGRQPAAQRVLLHGSRRSRGLDRRRGRRDPRHRDWHRAGAARRDLPAIRARRAGAARRIRRRTVDRAAPVGPVRMAREHRQPAGRRHAHRGALPRRTLRTCRARRTMMHRL